MSALEPGGMMSATGVDVSVERLGKDLTASGTPRAGAVTMAVLEPSGVEIGVWEHTPGVSTDTEVDEVLIVLSGRGRIDFIEPELPSLIIGPGDVVRLAAGMRTRWTVTETLRKVYIS